MLVPASIAKADDSASGQGSFTVPLTISAVSASGIGYYGAAISWETNGGATSQIFYDTVYHENIAGYANKTIEETTLVTDHSILLTRLASSTTYHYRVKSAIGTEFVATSGDYTFTTLTPGSGGGGGGGGPGPTPSGPPPGTTDVSGIVSTAGIFQESATALSEDRLCTLDIPTGTVGLTAELEPLTEITIVIIDEPPPPPEDANVIGLVYDFGPDGAIFEPPITLTFSYDPADIPEGVAEEDLVIAWYDEATDEWVELEGCVVDPETNTITAPVSHFTAFGAMFIPAPAAFSLSTLAVSPAEAEIGSPITISAVVENTGEKMGILRVILKIDGKVEQVEYITLDPGASKEVSFTISRDTAGSYAVDVNGLTGSFTIKEKPAPVPVPTPVPSKPVSWPVIGGILGGVTVVGLLIFFWIRRREVRAWLGRYRTNG